MAWCDELFEDGTHLWSIRSCNKEDIVALLAGACDEHDGDGRGETGQHPGVTLGLQGLEGLGRI